MVSYALDQLVEAGNSAVVTEHNLDVIKNTDGVIDLGHPADEGKTMATPSIFIPFNPS